MTYDIGNPSAGSGHTQKCVWVKPVDGLPTPPHLDNCISNGHADKKKYAQIHLHSYIVVCIKNYINIQIFQNIIDKTEWLNLTLHFKLIFFRSFSSR
jgi:hypothetical protein